MKNFSIICLLLFFLVINLKEVNAGTQNKFNGNTKISDVINNPLFGSYGRFIFPLNSSYYSGDTLGNLRLTWYSNIKPSRTVEIINYMLAQVQDGNKIFYRIYPENANKAHFPRDGLTSCL